MRAFLSVVQEIVDQVASVPEHAAEREAFRAKRRLIVVILPAVLPFKEDAVWKNWPPSGREVTLNKDSFRPGTSLSERLLQDTSSGPRSKGLLDQIADDPHHSSEDMWIIDADSALQKSLPSDSTSAKKPLATYLSCARLKPFQEAFLHKLNWIQKDLGDADAVLENLRQVDVHSLCPPELAALPAAREFVRELFLSGNGSTVFSNAFVQWAASEAFRRARPSVVVTRFGTRNKPKPFTSVAILENQAKASPLPDVVDPAGSAIDAQILARYVWLSASRFEEYANTTCICIADSIPSLFVIAPPDQPLLAESRPFSIDEVRSEVAQWLSSGDRD